MSIPETILDWATAIIAMGVAGIIVCVLMALIILGTGGLIDYFRDRRIDKRFP